MAQESNTNKSTLISTGKDISKKIFDTYKESDNFKDFMLSDTMKGLYERAGTKIDQVLLELQDNKAFNKFLDIISKTDTGASISDAIKDRIEKIGEEYDPTVVGDEDSYTAEELAAVDLNDSATMAALQSYINPEGEIAFAKLCDELQLGDFSDRFVIVKQHVELAAKSSHSDVMEAYHQAYIDLGYSGKDHPSMATQGDMIKSAQNHIMLCQEYDSKDVFKAYDSAISTLGFGDPNNHPNIEQTPGMMSVVQDYIALSRDYSEAELKNMYEYASEKTGAILSDDMQENINDLKTIQDYIDMYFVQGHESIPDVVAKDDPRSLSDILKDDSAEIQADFNEAIVEADYNEDCCTYYPHIEPESEPEFEKEFEKESEKESEVEPGPDLC